MQAGRQDHPPPTGPLRGPSPHVNTMSDNCGSGCGYGGRRYLSKDERATMLKDYQKELENELQGVKERLQELTA